MSDDVTPTRVLVIDDDVAITLALATVLRAKGYAVVTAPDGATGLAHYRAHRPHVVITDLMMPEGRGIEAIETIRRASADVLIIAMSGSVEALGGHVFEQAGAVGANAYLHKPFELHELLDALGHLPTNPDQPLAR